MRLFYGYSNFVPILYYTSKSLPAESIETNFFLAKTKNCHKEHTDNMFS